MEFFISTLSAMCFFIWVFWGRTTALPMDFRILKTSAFCVFAIILYTIWGYFYADFSYMLVKRLGMASEFILAGVFEESIKFFAVYFATDGMKNLRRKTDILLYGIISAVTFGVLENFLYCLEWGGAIGISRCIYSVPSHIIYSLCVMVFALRYLKDLRFFHIVFGILLMGMIHGISNICLMSESVLTSPFGVFICFIGELFLLAKIIKEYKSCFYKYFI